MIFDLIVTWRNKKTFNVRRKSFYLAKKRNERSLMPITILSYFPRSWIICYIKEIRLDREWQKERSEMKNTMALSTSNLPYTVSFYEIPLKWFQVTKSNLLGNLLAILKHPIHLLPEHRVKVENYGILITRNGTRTCT